jgi:glycosyltransferase involved in cell wall biosynthesis
MMEFLPNPPPSRPDNDIPIITYAGALNMHLQGETIVHPIASAIAELNAEDFRVHLHIYTPWQFAPIANSLAMPGAIYYMGQVNRENLAKAYWDSDFLLTTVTFRPKSLLLFKHSLSTKLSEYLSMGKPVISAGHPDWHLHEYVQEHNCGWAIQFDANYQRALIKEELKRIISTPKAELRRIGEKNRQLWIEAHDVKVMARQTRSVIGLPS